MASNTPRPSSTPQPGSRRSITERVMSWPRYGRMALVFFAVIILAFTLQQIVGELYHALFSTRVALSTISWVVTIVCLATYLAGYYFIIGTPGSTPPASRGQTVYLAVVGALALISSAWMLMRAIGAFTE